MLQVYRIDPYPDMLHDPAWAFSTCHQTLWVKAESPEKARQLAAIRALNSPPWPNGRPIPLAPWQDEKLTGCVMDNTFTEIAPYEVVTSEGQRVGIEQL
jgi:hypothetical protein